MLLLESHSIRNSREIPREETLFILPVITTFFGCLSLATILTETWVRLTLRFGLRWLSWFTQHKWKRYPDRQGCQETVLASRLNYEGSFEFLLTGHRNIVLKSTGSSPKPEHKEVVLRHCHSHPVAASAASQHSALLSPLSHVHKQVLRTPSACLQAQQRAAGTVLCRLPKDCSQQHETQAALWEGHPIPNNMPDTTLLTHASSQLQFSSRGKCGREWACSNTYVAIEVNSTAKITLKVIETLCWGLVAQRDSIHTTS